MTAIIPLFLPSPYRPSSCFGGYLDSSAVHAQTQQQASQHREVMGALRDLRKDTITVAVLSSAVLPLCNAALDKLEGPARDYDTAMQKWRDRVRRIRSWQEKRRDARKEKQLHERWLAEIEGYVTRNSRWWRNPERVRREAERVVGSLGSFSRYHLAFGGRRPSLVDDYRDLYAKTRPTQPAGYDDIPAIGDLKSAASMAADAQLTVPVETVKRLMRWAA